MNQGSAPSYSKRTSQSLVSSSERVLPLSETISLVLTAPPEKHLPICANVKVISEQALFTYPGIGEIERLDKSY